MNDFGKKIEKAIRYCEDTDTYYVQFSFANRVKSKLRSFPTLELARQYRDAIYQAKLDVKIKEDTKAIYASERKDILNSEYEIFPMNVILDMGSFKEEVNPMFFEYNYFINFMNEYLRHENMKNCIMLRYNEMKTLEQISKQIGLTKERVRQIICRALKILKYRITQYQKIEYENKELAIKEKEVEDLKEQRQKLIEAYKINNNLQDAEIEAFFGKPTIHTSLNKFTNLENDSGIEILDLSVRSYNCLRRTGIRYISELCNFTKFDINKIRHLGQKSSEEIIYKMHKKGYKLKDE